MLHREQNLLNKIIKVSFKINTNYLREIKHKELKRLIELKVIINI
jgi:hypothetical protein